MNALSRASVLFSAVVTFLFANSAFAEAVDYSPLTSAIDVSGVQAAILAGAALMMGIVVVRWGARKVVGFWR